jgi:ABC-2 type transport system ATP-binding protein
MTNQGLAVAGLNKHFGTRQVLQGVSFSVPKGVLTGFVGGNGAGKTTTMRIILGVLSGDAGQVTLDGKPVDRASSSAFGYMPEERGLYPKMSAAQQCAFLAQLHGLNQREAEGRSIALLERLGLGKRAYDPVETLSLGNQQRAQIAAALVHDPSVLVLDEPFSGLDPMAVDAMVDLLGESARRGAAILFSSHQLELVERITEQVVIIAQGQIKAAGRRNDILAAHARPHYRLAAPGDLSWVAGQAGVTTPKPYAGGIMFTADDAAAQAVLRAAVARGPVESFGRVVPSLADVFKEVVADAVTVSQEGK